jgi:hypothetical protein
MRQAEHVAYNGGEEMYTGFQQGKLQEKDHLEDLGISRI